MKCPALERLIPGGRYHIRLQERLYILNRLRQPDKQDIHSPKGSSERNNSINISHKPGSAAQKELSPQKLIQLTSLWSHSSVKPTPSLKDGEDTREATWSMKSFWM